MRWVSASDKRGNGDESDRGRCGERGRRRGAAAWSAPQKTPPSQRATDSTQGIEIPFPPRFPRNPYAPRLSLSPIFGSDQPMRTLLTSLAAVAFIAGLHANEPPQIEDLYKTDVALDAITPADGRSAIYVRQRADAQSRSTRQSLWRVDDSGPPRALEAGEPDAFSPQLSPDGKWILFLSTRPFNDGTPAFAPVPPYSDPAADIWLLPVAVVSRDEFHPWVINCMAVFLNPGTLQRQPLRWPPPRIPPSPPPRSNECWQGAGLRHDNSPECRETSWLPPSSFRVLHLLRKRCAKTNHEQTTPPRHSFSHYLRAALRALRRKPRSRRLGCRRLRRAADDFQRRREMGNHCRVG